MRKKENKKTVNDKVMKEAMSLVRLYDLLMVYTYIFALMDTLLSLLCRVIYFSHIGLFTVLDSCVNKEEERG